MHDATWNACAWLLTASICGGLIALLRLLVHAGIVDKTLSRKLLHTGCGLLYLLCWPLYAPGWPWSAALCASVPALATLHFVLVGLGLQNDQELIRSFSVRHKRQGKPSELLLGPAPYGLIHVAATLRYWRGPPGGVLVIAILCAGDGVADIVGRRLGTDNKWAHNHDKSRAGTLAFFVAGGLAAFAALLYATANGLVSEELHWGEAARLATVCSAVGAVVESLPLPLDNLTVPAAVALAAHFLGRS